MKRLTAELREQTKQHAKLDAERKCGADPEDADMFRRDLHEDFKADYVLANPPFNDSDWHRSDKNVRWKNGLPPTRRDPRRAASETAVGPDSRGRTASRHFT